MKKLEKFLYPVYLFFLLAFIFCFLMSLLESILLGASFLANYQGVVVFTWFEKFFRLFYFVIALLGVYLSIMALDKAETFIEEDLKKQKMLNVII